MRRAARCSWLEGGLGRVDRTRVGKELGADPVAAWRAAFESLLELGVVDVDGNGPTWGSTVDDAMADIVVLAHLAEGALLQHDLIEWICDQEEHLLELQGDRSLSGGTRQSIAEDMQRVCAALADMGAISLDEQSLTSTPLGSWAAVQLMRDGGIEVRVIVE